jgi:hypothetical protein
MLHIKTKINNSGFGNMANGTSYENLRSISDKGSYQDKKSYEGLNS